MGWLGDLLKPGAKPKRSIAEVEKALSRLAVKRAEAREAVTAQMSRRDQLLLQDGSDALIAKADDEADRARLVLERLDRAEPILIQELQELRSEQKRQRWRDLRERHSEAALAYRDALRAALEKFDAVIAIDAEARAAGFEAEARAFAPPMRMVSSDTIAEYEIALDRQRDAAEAAMRPAPPPAPVTPLPVKAAPAKPALKAVPRPRVIQPAGEGREQIVVVRDGAEIDGTQYAVGDVLAVDPDRARTLLRAGAADRHGAAA